MSLPGATRPAVEGEYFVCFSSDPGAVVSDLLAKIKSQRDRLVDLRVERPSLEERFLEITNGGAR
jgi:ABC-2 type transport system ATP-binding protein